MLFLYEIYQKNRRSKIRKWEKARDKYLSEDSHGYRDVRHYEQQFPYPVFKWKPFLSKALPIALAAHVVVAVLLFIANHEPSKTQAKDETTKTEQSAPKAHKVGDKVQVVYGTFKDSVGEVMKVQENGGAIIKLTNSTYTKAMAEAENSQYGQDNGSLLDVNDEDNLVPYKEKQ